MMRDIMQINSSLVIRAELETMPSRFQAQSPNHLNTLPPTKVHEKLKIMNWRNLCASYGKRRNCEDFSRRRIIE